MLVIDDLGTEKISQWGLEKLFIIISNRYDNNLPIIITTKFNKNKLFNRFEQSKDKSLTEAVILKIYQKIELKILILILTLIMKSIEYQSAMILVLQREIMCLI